MNDNFGVHIVIKKDQNSKIILFLITVALFSLSQLTTVPIIQIFAFPLKFILFILTIKNFLSDRKKTLILILFSIITLGSLFHHHYFIAELSAILCSAAIFVFLTQKKICYLKSLFIASFFTVVIYWFYFLLNPQLYTELIESYHKLFMQNPALTQWTSQNSTQFSIERISNIFTRFFYTQIFFSQIFVLFLFFNLTISIFIRKKWGFFVNRFILSEQKNFHYLYWVLIFSLSIQLLSKKGMLFEFGLNLMAMVLICFCIYGICLLSYILKKKIIRPQLKFLIFFGLIFILNYVSLFLLIGLGISDSFFNWKLKINSNHKN